MNQLNTINRDPEIVCTPKRIGVLILNLNGAAWLPEVYSALEKQDAQQIHVYLVDNASTDESIALTLEDYPWVKVLMLPDNLGYSVAYNAATPIAFSDGCDAVVWANSDIKLDAECLRCMQNALEQNPRVGILGPSFLDWECDEPNAYMKEVNPEAIPPMLQGCQDPIPVHWVEGSFLMVKKDCFEDVGPLDPDYFFYWEEADYCRRARFLGWEVAIVPSAIARHYGGGSVTHPSHKDRFMRLKTRNEYIYRGTDPGRSWTANLVSIAHMAAVNVKAGLLGRGTTLSFEIAAASDAIRQLAMMRRKWSRDRSGQVPSAWRGSEPVRCTLISKEDDA